MTALQICRPNRGDDDRAPLVYPFVAAVLDPSDFAFVVEELARAERTAPLLSAHPGLTRVAAVFLRYCSPVAPDRDALALVVRFLRIVLFLNDRVEPARIAEDADTVWQHVVGPGRASPGVHAAAASSLELAAADLGRHLARALASRGAEATSFAHLLRMNLAAFVRLNDPAGQEPAEYLELRCETISAAAYLRLWGLLGGLEPSSELRVGFLLQRAERLSARVQALANDLRSVDRDAGAGQANVVLIEQAARGVSREAALAAIRARHDEDLRALVTVLAAARARASHAPGLARYVRFIEVCTYGNNLAMDELSARYS